LKIANVFSSVPETTVPETIVGSNDVATDQAPATPTAEDFLAELNAAQIAQLGGIECATELATVAAAGERYVAEVGSDPATVQDMYDKGHIRGAKLIPVNQIGERGKELPRDKKIVTYCS